MNLLNFVEQYSDEDSCKAAFKAYRDKEGVVCPKCGCKEHFWLKGKDAYQCKCCGTRQGLRSHTVMHGFHLSFRYWFIAIHLLTSTKKSFSAAELQCQLGHKRYEPIWLMMHKLRDVMGQRNTLDELTDVVELDEGFFTTEIEDEEKDEPLKRGRGSQRKTKVVVMAESKSVEGEKTKKRQRAQSRTYKDGSHR